MQFTISSYLCVLILTVSPRTISSATAEDTVTKGNKLPESESDPNASDNTGSKWKVGNEQEMLGTFVHVDKAYETKDSRSSSEHIGEVTEGIEGNSHSEYKSPIGPNDFTPSNSIESSLSDFKPRGVDVQFQPSVRLEVDPLQEPPRTARDYAVSPDNYGWSYPSTSASGANIATAPGSASYYPSADYSKPSTESKYYSWAAPGPADDKYKRPAYFTYTVNQGGVPVECIPIPMAGTIISEMTKVTGSGGVGKSLIRTLLSALVALFVIKIPFMIAIKAIIFKLFVLPATIVMISLPVLMPLLYFFLPSFMKDKDKSTTPKPTVVMMMNSANSSTRSIRGLFHEEPRGLFPEDPWGRNARTLFHEDGSVTQDFEELLRSLIAEQSCVEKIACQFGVRDAQSQYRKPISWALKYVQTLKPVLTDASLRTKLKMYRDAYNFGADIASSNASVSGEPHAICTDTLYPCQKPQVIVKQARTVYKLV